MGRLARSLDFCVRCGSLVVIWNRSKCMACGVRFGNCYRDALMYLLDHGTEADYLAHVRGRALNGIEVDHAFVYLNFDQDEGLAKVWDPAPGDIVGRVCQLRLVRTYGVWRRSKALEHVLKVKTYGPWRDDELGPVPEGRV